MNYLEGLERLHEIATGDKEKEALEAVEQAMEAYRTLYEGAEKRIQRYRDVASTPDVFIPEYNKDSFNDGQTAEVMYRESRAVKPEKVTNYKDMVAWLFERAKVRDGGK